MMCRPVHGNLLRDSEPVDDKKPQFEIDLRVERVSQDAILQCDEKMKEINEKVGAVKNWIMHEVHS